MTDIDFNKLDPILETKITHANNSMSTLAEAIIDVYDTAKRLGHDPKNARKIVELRIINVTPQYLRKILPQEAKQLQYHDREKEWETRKSETTVSPSDIQITSTQEITDVDSTPEPHTTFLYHKASELDEQEKYFRMDSEIDKYKKLAFDKQQIIEEKDIQIERLTNQVNSQTEHIKQNLTGTEQPKIFPFTLETKTLMHECPKCHLHQDLPITGRVYHQNSWIVYIDNIEAQKQQAQKWRT